MPGTAVGPEDTSLSVALKKSFIRITVFIEREEDGAKFRNGRAGLETEGEGSFKEFKMNGRGKNRAGV